ncbi:MAG: hypothetical protein IKR46_02450, partial [Clostridia bacterium]|nr:hypothetical protein [Clostridia bacterium]
MKFKKLTSLLATVAISSAMLILPAKTSASYSWWHMDESAANSDENSGPAVVDFAGKGSGYAYAFTGKKTHTWLTSSFADTSKRLAIPEDYLTYEGYMLISMNVYSPSEQQFQFQVKDSYPITPNVTVKADNGFNINRWNKILAVVKLSATRANRTGYYYVNGVKKPWNSDGHYLFEDSNFNTIRLRTQKDDVALYIEDVHVAFTKESLT